MNKNNTNGKTPLIIAGFAGIGKTYLATKYDSVLDLESSKFVYDYSNVSPKDYEKMKGNKNRTPNKDFPNNYIQAIKNNMLKYKVIFVWLKPEMLQLYDENGIDYSICYPSKSAFQEYKKRYEQRGNSAEWINKVINVYDTFTSIFSLSPKNKIILNEDEYIEDWLLKNGYLS